MHVRTTNKEALRDALRLACFSPCSLTRQQSMHTLEQMQRLPGFVTACLRVIDAQDLGKDLPAACRQLAAILLKSFAGNHWFNLDREGNNAKISGRERHGDTTEEEEEDDEDMSVSDEDAHTDVLSESERCAVRDFLVAYMHETDCKTALQLALLTARIARLEVLAHTHAHTHTETHTEAHSHWTQSTLLPALLRHIQSQGTHPLHCFRASFVLREVLRELCRSSGVNQAINTQFLHELCVNNFPVIARAWAANSKYIQAHLNTVIAQLQGVSPLSVSLAAQQHSHTHSHTHALPPTLTSLRRNYSFEIKCQHTAVLQEVLRMLLEIALPGVMDKYPCFSNFWRTYLSSIQLFAAFIQRMRPLCRALVALTQEQHETAAALCDDMCESESERVYEREMADYLLRQAVQEDAEDTQYFIPLSLCLSHAPARAHARIESGSQALFVCVNTVLHFLRGQNCTPIVLQRKYPLLVLHWMDALLAFYYKHIVEEYSDGSSSNSNTSSCALSSFLSSPPPQCATSLSVLPTHTHTETNHSSPYPSPRPQSVSAGVSSPCPLAISQQSLCQTHAHTDAPCVGNREKTGPAVSVSAVGASVLPLKFLSLAATAFLANVLTCEQYRCESSSSSMKSNSSGAHTEHYAQHAQSLLRSFFTAERVRVLLQRALSHLLVYNAEEIRHWQSEGESFFVLECCVRGDREGELISQRSLAERLCVGLSRLSPSLVAEVLHTHLCDTPRQQKVCTTLALSHTQQREALFWDALYVCAGLSVDVLVSERRFAVSAWCVEVMSVLFAQLLSAPRHNGALLVSTQTHSHTAVEERVSESVGDNVRESECVPLLCGRLVWLLSQWIPLCEASLYTQLLPFLTSLLAPTTDVVVRLRAVQALRSLLCARDFVCESVWPYVPTLTQGLCALLCELCESDTQVMVCDTLRELVSLCAVSAASGVCAESVKECFVGVMQMLCGVWKSLDETDVIRGNVLELFIETVKAAGHHSHSFIPSMLPILCSSLCVSVTVTQTGERSVRLSQHTTRTHIGEVAQALRLWIALLRNTDTHSHADMHSYTLSEQERAELLWLWRCVVELYCSESASQTLFAPLCENQSDEKGVRESSEECVARKECEEAVWCLLCVWQSYCVLCGPTLFDTLTHTQWLRFAHFAHTHCVRVLSERVCIAWFRSVELALSVDAVRCVAWLSESGVLSHIAVCALTALSEAPSDTHTDAQAPRVTLCPAFSPSVAAAVALYLTHTKMESENTHHTRIRTNSSQPHITHLLALHIIARVALCAPRILRVTLDKLQRDVHSVCSASVLAHTLGLGPLPPHTLLTQLVFLWAMLCSQLRVWCEGEALLRSRLWAMCVWSLLPTQTQAQALPQSEHTSHNTNGCASEFVWNDVPWQLRSKWLCGALRCTLAAQSLLCAWLSETQAHSPSVRARLLRTQFSERLCEVYHNAYTHTSDTHTDTHTDRELSDDEESDTAHNAHTHCVGCMSLLSNIAENTEAYGALCNDWQALGVAVYLPSPLTERALYTSLNALSHTCGEWYSDAHGKQRRKKEAWSLLCEREESILTQLTTQLALAERDLCGRDLWCVMCERVLALRVAQGDEAYRHFLGLVKDLSTGRR